MAKMIVVEISVESSGMEEELNKLLGILNRMATELGVQTRSFSLEAGQNHLAQVPEDAE